MKHNKKLKYTEREMIKYLYKENQLLKLEKERLERRINKLEVELYTFKEGNYDAQDTPAIGAPHGW